MARAPLTLQTHLTAQGFREFYLFDVLGRTRAWRRPVLFAGILCAAGAVCFAFQARQRGAAALGLVLVVVGLGLPLAFFGSIRRFLSGQIQRLGLKDAPKAIATVTLAEDGIVVEGGPEPLRYGWEDVVMAYRAPLAVYLYVGENQAHLLPHADAGGPEVVWEILRDHLPPERMEDRCKRARRAGA